MAQLDKITKIILDSIDELNQRLPEQDRIEKTSDAALYGRPGNLSSLRLVELIVTVEQRLEADFDVAVTLADEKAVSQTRNPFATVSSFSQYIAKRLKTV